MATRSEVIEPQDARKTYRYLRVAMILAVVALGASILIERSKVECFQTSISAYYYTPVRAVFVGGLIAVGFALIVYKGRPWEDRFLNLAGMLAPLVAVAPTTDVGSCWSLPPIPAPKNEDGTLATWVSTNIDNNVDALFLAGAIGLLIAGVIAIVVRRTSDMAHEWERGTTISLVSAGVVLVLTFALSRWWDDFDTRAHGFAAVAMFVFLVLAVISNILDKLGSTDHDDRWRQLGGTWWCNVAVAGMMVVLGILIPWSRVFDEHTVFALEAVEIVLFAVYWTIQTVENWSERVAAAP